MSSLRERIVVGGALALFAAAFAWLNGGVRVGVNLGFVRVDAVPLPIVVFTAFLLGMLTLFLASLKADLRMQRMLRRYREALGSAGVAAPRAAGTDPTANRAAAPSADAAAHAATDPGTEET